jgi:group I intron endonuclease
MEQGYIYRIVNTVNWKQYIGSTARVADRWKEHQRLLNAGKHHSPVLQRAWIKYGSEAFSFEILCTTPPDKDSILAEEQLCLDWLPCEYNICTVAGSPLGRKHSPKARARMSESQRNRPPASEETRAKISEAGRRRRGEKRPPLSPEHRAKIAEAGRHRRGEKRPPRSLEYRAKMSEVKRGQKHSPETREKLSEAARLREAKRKAAKMLESATA